MSERLAEIKAKWLTQDEAWLVAEVERLEAERVQLIQGLNDDARELKRLREHLDRYEKRLLEGEELLKEGVVHIERMKADCALLVREGKALRTDLRLQAAEGMEQAAKMCKDAAETHERNSKTMDRQLQEKMALYIEEDHRLAAAIRAKIKREAVSK